MVGSEGLAQAYRSETRAGAEEGEAIETDGPRTTVDLGDSSDTGAPLTDALDAAPAVDVARTGAVGAPAFLSIRGSEPYQVALSLDGVPLNGAQNRSFDLSLIPVELLGEATVYRATVPVQLGAPLPGGAVALRTRFADPGTRVYAGGGSWASRRVGFATNGRSGRGDWMVAGVYTGAANGFRYFDDGGTPFNQDDDAERARRNAHADSGGTLWRHLVRLDDWRLTNVLIASGSSQGVPGLGNDQARRTQLDRGWVFNALEARNRRLADGRVDLRLLVGGALDWQRYRDPGDELGLGAGTDRERTVLSVVGVRPTFELHQALEARAVVNWSHEDYRGRTGARRDTIAVGGELEFDPVAGRVVAGVGYRADTSFDSRATDPHVGAAPRAGLVVEPWQDRPWSVRGMAALSAAERRPGFFELYGDSGVVAGNPDLRPERRRGYDLGLQSAGEWDVAWGTPHFSVTYGFFDRRIEDLVTFVQTGLGVAIAQNVSEAAVRGHEVAARAGVRDRVAVHASYRLIDALDRSVRPHAQLPGRPVHGYSGGVRAQHHWIAVEWSAEGNGQFFLDRTESRPMPPRVRHDLGVDITPRLAWEPRVHLRVENVGDHRTEDVALPDGGESVRAPRAVADFVGQPLPGRAFFVSVSLSPERSPRAED